MDNGIVLGTICRYNINAHGLNPCCSGQWYRTHINGKGIYWEYNVLILVVVDNGIVLTMDMDVTSPKSYVLILVVVDNGIVLQKVAE